MDKNENDPKLPRTHRRLAIRAELAHIRRSMLCPPGPLMLEGASDPRHPVQQAGVDRRLEDHSQLWFQPLRLIVEVASARAGLSPAELHAVRSRVKLEMLLIGSQAVFQGEVPVSFFADRLPSEPEVAESDTWDDGGRVDYPEVGPGIHVSFRFSNGDRDGVRIQCGLLGLASNTAFPWHGQPCPEDIYDARHYAPEALRPRR
ncbi:MAG TPA: hypothetical protein VKR78_07570 [Acidimicrobiales bacterium]|nr:hypothetical protein [Acidimicrobiales bacterium]